MEWGSSGGGGSLADLSDVTNPVFSSFYIGQKTSDYTITDTSSHQNIGIGSYAMRYISGSYDNVAIGYDALVGTSGQFSAADRNVAIGSNSMRVISTGDDNVAVGYAALKANTIGINNVAIGTNALLNNVGGYNGAGDLTAGINNVAVGYEALKSNTGSENVAVGKTALATNNGGENNVAIGNESLSGNTSGGRNTAVGHKAMFLNETGQRNAAFGYLSGKSGDKNASFGAYSLNAVTGDSNTAVGYYAGSGGNSNTAIVTGINNVLIGRDAGVDDDDAENRIVIGKDARGLENNTVTIGNSSITAWLSGSADNVDLGTSSNQFDVVYANKLGFGSQAMTLPTADGSNGQVLKTDGAGTLSWTTAPGVKTYSVGTYYAELGGWVVSINSTGTHGLVISGQKLGTVTIDIDPVHEISNVVNNAYELISNPANYNSDGQEFYDWRMPTFHEMKNIVGAAYFNSSLTSFYKLAALDYAYWTSKPGNGTDSWSIVDLDAGGSLYSGSSGGNQHVIAVRAF